MKIQERGVSATVSKKLARHGPKKKDEDFDLNNSEDASFSDHNDK